ncbi:MAG: ABC transporter permease [Microbacterium sp.]|uniref:ABC transporter permease n=1 Tax=Microbacterium sp. TaxID=51671 RepID=UPI0039E448D3
MARAAGVVGSKLGELIIVVALIVLLTSVLVRLIPGSPATTILGSAASAEAIESLNQQLGLDRPVWAQAVNGLLQVATGDLGQSLTEGRSVWSIILDALPVTLSVIFVALVIALLVGLTVGLVAGYRNSRRWGHAVDLSSSILIALPPFVTGTVLLLVFGIWLNVLPAGGWGASPIDNVRFIWLPAITLSMVAVAPIARTAYRSTQEVMKEEYVDAARSRALSETHIAIRHVLPITALPLITLVAFNASILLGGAIIVEAVFGLPGFGQALSTAVLSRDYPTVAGMTIASAIFVVIINMVADLAVAFIDPVQRGKRWSR